ncbi:hypothetical protein PENSUB_6543 [Penicillium subrubescens]|uniref:xyloglucan-specific endo-beta-1,4-glucanase n=1 Tax=Penicillium subrubescens TaxID=1316194 RepID=A0A1Q5U0Q1_9EURO|nr:hypothetical protein PENSUB_6543 [Penicillium subrubescens]
MIWVAYQLPNTPLSDHYDSKGVAVPWAQNVNLGGKAWDVYLYHYTRSNIVADVAYNIFTSNSPDGPGAYEIMIWVAALGGAGPISSTGKPVATVQIARTT